MNVDWSIDGMKQDDQNVTSDWQHVGQTLISDVVIREVQSVTTGYGHLTEIFRSDWSLDEFGVDQVFQSSIQPGGISAWHAHGLTTDRLFVNHGQLNIVLYDGRRSSVTYGLINQFRFGTARHAMVVIPPGVWHGVHNTSSKVALLTNVVDRAYTYQEPDHYRLPADTDEIPFCFSDNRVGR